MSNDDGEEYKHSFLFCICICIEFVGIFFTVFFLSLQISIFSSSSPIPSPFLLLSSFRMILTKHASLIHSKPQPAKKGTKCSSTHVTMTGFIIGGLKYFNSSKQKLPNFEMRPSPCLRRSVRSCSHTIPEKVRNSRPINMGFKGWE